MTASRTASLFGGLIAPERRAATDDVLRRALPGACIAAVSALTGGASGAVMLRIDAADASFVLRLDGPPDEFRDPARQYACQAIAAGAGLAPALLHSDPVRRISLSAFVRDTGAAMSRAVRLTAIAASVRRLHDGPAFPPLLPYMDAMGFVMAHFVASKLVPDAVGDEIAARFAQLALAYAHVETDVVASHCDLNPGNILFDRERAVFVDWESAFAADRYVDIAAILNYLAIDAADEDRVLTAYFGRAPSAHERARTAAMRQVNRLFYGAMLLSAAAAQGMRATGDDLTAKTYAQLRGAPIGVSGADGKIALGCAFLSDALSEMNRPKFREVLARVRS